jgi:hypothetical protein
MRSLMASTPCAKAGCFPLALSRLAGETTEGGAGCEDFFNRMLADIFEQTHQTARREAETIIGHQRPEKCEWTLEQVRSDTFYPEPGRAPP